MSDLETGDVDGEGWGRWDGVPLPRWVRSWMAPYSAATRERRLQELLDALNASPATPIGGLSDQGNSSSSVQIEPPIGVAHKAEGSS